MKNYEFVFIVKPDLTSSKLKKILAALKKEIEAEGGKVKKEDNWGKKPLAYPIDNCQQGDYFFWQLSFEESPKIRSLTTFLSRQKEIIRHLMVRVNK